VREYVVLLTLEQETIWYRSNEGRYEPIQPDAGVIRSAAFPGLHFNPNLFWADDDAGLLNVLRAGLAMAEHQAFVQSLAPSA
jgi:hypothetical protein